MSDEVIEYQCKPKRPIGNPMSFLDISTTNGLKCIWSGILDPGYAFTNNDSKMFLTWKFEWNEEVVESLSGHITVKSCGNGFSPIKFHVELNESGQLIVREILRTSLDGEFQWYFEYCFTPKSDPPFYEDMFLPSEKNDAVLIVEDKKLNVNKAFLSYHSDYFRALFSSNYKEGSMDEITIERVSFEDFGLLLSTFYPRAVFPNDKTAQKLLELSDRFMIPSVIHHVEHHLLHISKIDNESMMWMADKYGMPRLLKKTIRKLDSFEKAKQLEQYEGYSELSKDTKAKLLKRVLQLIRMNT